MKRKGSARYDYTAQKKYKLGDTFTKQSIDTNGGDQILASIGAPFSKEAAGARFPDLNMQASATSTFILETTQKVNAQGCTGGILNLNSAATYYCEEQSGSTDGQIKYCSNGTFGSQTGVAGGNNGQIDYSKTYWEASDAGDLAATVRNKLLPSWGSLYGQASGLRITGAAIQVEFTGNDTQNQGLVTSYATSWSDIEQQRGPTAYPIITDGTGLCIASTQTVAENFRTNYNGAFKNGVNLTWLPSDNGDLEYGTVPVVNPTGISILGNATNKAPCANLPLTRLWGFAPTLATISVGATDRDVRNYGSLMWHVSGGAVGASCRVTVVVHTEWLPVNDTPIAGIDMAIARPLSSVMDLLSSLSSGNTTGSSALTTAVSESLGSAYKAASNAAMYAVNNANVSAIGDALSEINMSQDASWISKVGTFFKTAFPHTPIGKAVGDMTKVYNAMSRMFGYSGKSTGKDEL